MSDTVRIEGVRGHGAHGVLPEEKRRAQPFVVDVEMEVEPAAADSIECTVSYADVAADALAVVEGESADLVETTAARLAERVQPSEPPSPSTRRKPPSACRSPTSL